MELGQPIKPREAIGRDISERKNGARLIAYAGRAFRTLSTAPQWFTASDFAAIQAQRASATAKAASGLHLIAAVERLQDAAEQLVEPLAGHGRNQ